MRCLAMAVLVWRLAALAPAQEIGTLDEWWSAYDAACKNATPAAALQLVADHKVLACKAFNEGMMSYRSYRDAKDIVSMRQFYAFLELLGEHLAVAHGLTSYRDDLASETAGDAEALGAAKRRADAEIFTDPTKLLDAFVAAVAADDDARAALLVRDNPVLAASLYEDLLHHFGRARNADEKRRMVAIHGYLAPLEANLQEAFVGDPTYERHDPPSWVLTAAEQARARRLAEREESTRARMTPAEIAAAEIARAVPLRDDAHWEEAIRILDDARIALELSEAPPEVLIDLHRELARTYLEYHDYAHALSAYRELERAATWIGKSDVATEARTALASIPAEHRAPYEDESQWSSWKAVKLETVTQPGKQDLYGPARDVDPRPELWPSLDLSAAARAAIGPPGVALVREDDQIRLDVDGDGKGEVEIDWKTGKPVEIVTTYPDGSRQEYAIAFKRHRVFEYGDFTFDHSQRHQIFYRRVGWREGRMGGTHIVISDDDADGRFDGYGRDGMVVGHEKIGTTLSRLIATGDDIIEIAVHPTGASLEYRTWQGKKTPASGFAAAGTPRNFIIAAAADPTVLLELAAGKNGANIPPGSWRFHQAVLSDVRNTQRVWVDGRACQPQTVDETTRRLSFEIGRALDYRWRITASDKEVRIHGLSFQIVGDGGETYGGWWPTPPLPMVTLHMEIPDSERVIHLSAQTIQRDSTSPSHRDTEFPKDLVFEMKVEADVTTRIALEHPIIGALETTPRVQKIEHLPEAKPKGGGAPPPAEQPEPGAPR